MAIATVGYDKKAIHGDSLLLSLPFREQIQAVLGDRAKPHHPVLGNISWATLPSGLGVLSLDGATEYADCLAVNCADLDFTTEDYSIVGWINYQASMQSQIVVGRYGVDLDGWEVYLYSVNNTLSLRHHHASLVPARTGCYSEGWTTGAWHLFGISRSGAYPLMYRNGEELEMAYTVGGLSDPDACNRDLVIGVRYTKNADWYKGCLALLRIWGGRALEPWEHKQIYEMERHWFVS